MTAASDDSPADAPALPGAEPDRPAGTAAPAPPRKPTAAWRVAGALLLCLTGAAVSGVLLLEHHGVNRFSTLVEQVCGEGADTGCDAVAQSPYSEVRGIPLAAAGLAFYGSMVLLLLLGLVSGPAPRAAAASLGLLALGVSLLVDLGLLGVQLVAVRAFCSLCLLTYAAAALAVLLLWPARRPAGAFGDALRRPEGRLAVVAWGAATAVLSGGVFAVESALDYRGRLQAATILGEPPAPRTPAPGGTPSAEPSLPPPSGDAGAPAGDVLRWQEEARAATEQARRLQEILDDPQKLDAYLGEKAVKEFEAGPVHDVKLDGVPYKGPGQAPIRVVEYSDFLCPFCRNIAAAFASYLPTAGGRVMVYFKHYPLDTACNPHVNQAVHPGACLLAMGGVCAQEQGRFWNYHDRVFAAELKAPDWKAVLGLAAEAGLDVATFESCLQAPRTKETVAAQIAEGHKAGVRGTPTLFVNGKRLPRINDFTAAVDREAQRLGLPAPPPAPR